MARGCTPVLSRRGALPEVGGPDAIYIEQLSPKGLAEAIRKAMRRTGPQPSSRDVWRRRVLDGFPIERRRRRLHALVEALIAGRTAPPDD
jgi:hypothetical protein